MKIKNKKQFFRPEKYIFTFCHLSDDLGLSDMLFSSFIILLHSSLQIFFVKEVVNCFPNKAGFFSTQSNKYDCCPTVTLPTLTLFFASSFEFTEKNCIFVYIFILFIVSSIKIINFRVILTGKSEILQPSKL